jgi:hypothetical protein
MSILFFRWVVQAADLYYTSAQIIRHRSLLTAVRQHISTNTPCHQQSSSPVNSSILDAFSFSTSDDPVIIGFSLAKQTLDPAHWPIQLQINNNHYPFLYRLVLTNNYISTLSVFSYVAWWGRGELLFSLLPGKHFSSGGPGQSNA